MLKGLDDDVIKVLANLPLSKEKAAEMAIDTGMMVGARMKRALSRTQKGNTPPFMIFPSEVGQPCMRKLWYDRHYDAANMASAEEISPQTKLKFMYGDLIESIAVPLIKATGRVVTGIDESFKRTFTATDGNVWTVSGRTDLIVDDCVVDIKSMSGISFKMFQQQGIPRADHFGYRWQLHTYNWLRNSENDSALLGINKENGSVNLIENESTDLGVVEDRLQLIAKSVSHKMIIPAGMPDEPEGASGNRKLCTTCSYCKYKHSCWATANSFKGLRKFLYAGNKPVYLTEVRREPKVPEVT